MKKQNHVRFCLDKNEVCNMVTWQYAYKQSRIGKWEKMALDRFRFARKIKILERLLCHILTKKHRNRIYDERFS